MNAGAPSLQMKCQYRLRLRMMSHQERFVEAQHFLTTVVQQLMALGLCYQAQQPGGSKQSHIITQVYNEQVSCCLVLSVPPFYSCISTPSFSFIIFQADLYCTIIARHVSVLILAAFNVLLVCLAVRDLPFIKVLRNRFGHKEKSWLVMCLSSIYLQLTKDIQLN